MKRQKNGEMIITQRYVCELVLVSIYLLNASWTELVVSVDVLNAGGISRTYLDNVQIGSTRRLLPAVSRVLPVLCVIHIFRRDM